MFYKEGRDVRCISKYILLSKLGPAEFSSNMTQQTCMEDFVCLVRPWLAASGLFK